MKIFIVYNENMRENIEIFNFLNLINPKLGEFYKKTGYNPLPEGFLPTNEHIKEVLILSQIPATQIPEFLNENKKTIKKYFKKNYKNSKKMADFIYNFKNLSPEFAKKLEIYFKLRATLTHIFLKEFSSQGFNEVSALQEIEKLNPILFEKFQPLFCDNFQTSLCENIEEEYLASYNQKLKLIEKKNNKKAKQENNKILVENSKKTIKKVEKTAKNRKNCKSNLS